MLERLKLLGLSMGHSSPKGERKSWVVASEGYRKAGEARVVISLIFVRAGVSRSLEL